MQMLYACENVRTVDVRRQAEHAADARLPRARLRRGHVRARVPARRARGKARARPARAAPAQPRGLATPPTATAVLRARTCSSATAAPSRTGSARRGARAVDEPLASAASGSRSQIWYGGGGPPSYAWVRVGSDGARDGRHRDAGHRHGHADGDGADRGGGARPPARPRRGRRSATRRAARTRRSPPARRRRRRWARPCARRPPTRSGRSSRSPRSASTSRSASLLASRTADRLRPTAARWPLTEITGLLGRRPDPRHGSARPESGRHAGADLRRAGRGGRGRRRDRRGARRARSSPIHDVGRVINPLGAGSQVEGGIIQGIGHTLSEERLLDPATGSVLTQTLDAYRLPTIADVPEIVCELVDVPDAHLTNLGSKGPRRAADRPDRRGDRERDPRRDGCGRPLAADHARGDAARAARGARARGAGARGAPAAV